MFWGCPGAELPGAPEVTPRRGGAAGGQPQAGREGNGEQADGASSPVNTGKCPLGHRAKRASMVHDRRRREQHSCARRYASTIRHRSAAWYWRTLRRSGLAYLAGAYRSKRSNAARQGNKPPGRELDRSHDTNIRRKNETHELSTIASNSHPDGKHGRKKSEARTPDFLIDRATKKGKITLCR